MFDDEPEDAADAFIQARFCIPTNLEWLTTSERREKTQFWKITRIM